MSNSVESLGDKRQKKDPSVWVLTDDRPGNTTQSIGLARALGWPFEVKELHFTPLARRLKKLFGPFAASSRIINAARSSVVAPPWPELVIAAGWRPGQVARWIQKQNREHTRTIQLGRKGGQVGGLFDIVISCSYFRLPPHPHRIEVAAPLTQVSSDRLTEAAEHWRSLIQKARPPYVMALVGGATKRHRWNREVARRLGEDLRAFARTINGSVFAVTSRRTGTEAAHALQEGLGSDATVHHWQPGQQDNPYLAYLALADVLVVTGESESMLAEAVAVGKPVYIYPLEEIPPQSFKAQVKDLVTHHAFPAEADQSTAKPLPVTARLCRWLIAAGVVRPRRDLHAFHQALVRRGVARVFGDSSPGGQQTAPLREIDEVARKVKVRLGYETWGE